MTVQQREQALLDLVEADRHARCTALLDEARSQARTLLARADADARAHVKQAFADESERARATLDAARAELQTRQRLHAQRHMEALLALGWRQLPEALRARWADASTRAQWIEHALTQARASLGACGWTLHHGSTWPDAEREALAPRLVAQTGTAPSFVFDPRIDAGLRLAAGGNVVDATLTGLLADRDEIGGRLVGLLEQGLDEPPRSPRSRPPEVAQTSVGSGPTGGLT